MVTFRRATFGDERRGVLRPRQVEHVGQVAIRPGDPPHVGPTAVRNDIGERSLRGSVVQRDAGGRGHGGRGHGGLPQTLDRSFSRAWRGTMARPPIQMTGIAPFFAASYAAHLEMPRISPASGILKADRPSHFLSRIRGDSKTLSILSDPV